MNCAENNIKKDKNDYVKMRIRFLENEESETKAALYEQKFLENCFNILEGHPNPRTIDFAQFSQTISDLVLFDPQSEQVGAQIISNLKTNTSFPKVSVQGIESTHPEWNIHSTLMSDKLQLITWFFREKSKINGFLKGAEIQKLTEIYIKEFKFYVYFIEDLCSHFEDSAETKEGVTRLVREGYFSNNFNTPNPLLIGRNSLLCDFFMDFSSFVILLCEKYRKNYNREITDSRLDECLLKDFPRVWPKDQSPFSFMQELQHVANLLVSGVPFEEVFEMFQRGDTAAQEWHIQQTGRTETYLVQSFVHDSQNVCFLRVINELVALTVLNKENSRSWSFLKLINQLVVFLHSAETRNLLYFECVGRIAMMSKYILVSPKYQMFEIVVGFLVHDKISMADYWKALSYLQMVKFCMKAIVGMDKKTQIQSFSKIISFMINLLLQFHGNPFIFAIFENFIADITKYSKKNIFSGSCL